MINAEMFPVGMRVLVVDDDPLCLLILERMLRQCSYAVTTCTRASAALSLLRESRNKFDLVITDVYMPDMDGFKLLELIGLEMDLPVIMMSANGETSAVMKGITHGACDYLLKPVRIEELRNIWQHVLRKKTKEVVREDTSGDWDDSRANEYQPDIEYNSKKRKEKVEEGADDPSDETNAMKKARVVWSIDLHQQFVNAVNQLGIDKAVPKRILEIMNVQGLTRENVASHLQKYRLYLKRLSGVDPQPLPVASFQASEGSSFGGTMHIQPGGKGAVGSATKSALNLGTGAGAGLSSFSRGPLGTIDAATLATLAQLQELQQRQQAANAMNNMGSAGTSGSLNTNLLTNSSTSIPQLQSLSPYDLNMLMQAQQETAARHRLRNAAALCGPEGLTQMPVMANLGGPGSLLGQTVDQSLGASLRGGPSSGGDNSITVASQMARSSGSSMTGVPALIPGQGNLSGNAHFQGGGTGNHPHMDLGLGQYHDISGSDNYLSAPKGTGQTNSASALLSQFMSHQQSQNLRPKYEPFQS